MLDQILDSTLAQLQSMLRLPVGITLRTPEYAVIEFPRSPGADYSWSLLVYDDGEHEICAHLSSEPSGKYFWHQIFELAEFHSAEESAAACLPQLKKLLSHQTRFMYKRRMISSDFRCECFMDNRWVHHSTGSVGLHFPTVTPREHTWTAPAIILNK